MRSLGDDLGAGRAEEETPGAEPRRRHGARAPLDTEPRGGNRREWGDQAEAPGTGSAAERAGWTGGAAHSRALTQPVPVLGAALVPSACP